MQVGQGGGTEAAASGTVEVQGVRFVFQTVEELLFDHVESITDHCAHLLVVDGCYNHRLKK